MDRLDGLLRNRSGPENGEATSREPSRETRGNFNEQPNKKRTYRSTRGRGSSSSYNTGDNRPRVQNYRGSSTGNRPTSHKRPTPNESDAGRCDSTNWSHGNQRRSHPSNSSGREIPEPLSEGKDAQAGNSRDATSMATALEPLNRSLKTFLTRLSRTSERSEKFRRVFKKPRCYKDDSDGCIDIWIEVMKLHFEEEELTERHERSATISNLEGTALNCVSKTSETQLRKSLKSC